MVFEAGSHHLQNFSDSKIIQGSYFHDTKLYVFINDSNSFY